MCQVNFIDREICYKSSPSFLFLCLAYMTTTTWRENKQYPFPIMVSPTYEQFPSRERRNLGFVIFIKFFGFYFSPVSSTLQYMIHEQQHYIWKLNIKRKWKKYCWVIRLIWLFLFSFQLTRKMKFNINLLFRYWKFNMCVNKRYIFPIEMCMCSCLFLKWTTSEYCIT